MDDISYLDPETIGGVNLYAYCLNNPVMYVDPSGNFVITLSTILIAAGIGAGLGLVAGGVYGGLTAYANGQNIWDGIWIGALAGMIMGAGAGIASLFIAPVFVGEGITVAVVTGTAHVTTSGIAMAIGISTAFGTGAAGGAISDMLIQKMNEGKVSDVKSVVISALQWGALNTLNSILCSLGGPLSNINSGIVTAIFNNEVSLIGFAIDAIRKVINDNN